MCLLERQYNNDCKVFHVFISNVMSYVAQLGMNGKYLLKFYTERLQIANVLGYPHTRKKL